MTTLFGVVFLAVWLRISASQNSGKSGFCRDIGELTFSYCEVEPLIVHGTKELATEKCVFRPKPKSKAKSDQQLKSIVPSNGTGWSVNTNNSLHNGASGPNRQAGGTTQTEPSPAWQDGKPVSGTLFKVLQIAVSACCGKSEKLAEFRR